LPPHTQPEGADAVASVAEQTKPSPQVAASALAFFMGDAPAPASAYRLPLEVDFGEPGAPNFQPCVFKALEAEQLTAAEEIARVMKDGVLERIDPFTRWCVLFAYACVEPNLPQALAARQAKGEKVSTTADVVARVFRNQPGVLQAVVYKLEAIARFDTDGQNAVREVAAGNG